MNRLPEPRLAEGEFQETLVANRNSLCEGSMCSGSSLRPVHTMHLTLCPTHRSVNRFDPVPAPPRSLSRLLRSAPHLLRRLRP